MATSALGTTRTAKLLIDLSRVVCGGAGSDREVAISTLAIYIARLQAPDDSDARRMNIEVGKEWEAYWRRTYGLLGAESSAGAGSAVDLASDWIGAARRSIRSALRESVTPLERTPALHLFRTAVPSLVSDAEILGALNNLAKANGAGGYVVAPTCKKTLEHGLKTETARWQAHDSVEKFALWSIGQIRTSPEYRRALFRATLVTGPEQMAILLVGYFALLLSLLRLLAGYQLLRRSRHWTKEGSSRPYHPRHPDELVRQMAIIARRGASPEASVREYWKSQLTDEITSARWPMRLAIGVLPAIGFIGTVRGIMNSLKGADAIVWAGTDAERAQAIGALSGDLGLAFATTLMALLIGVLLSILSAFELRVFERAVLPLFRQKPLAAASPD